MSELLFTEYIAINGLSWTEQRQVLSNISVGGLGTLSQDGSKYIQITGISVAVSGRNAPRTVALGLWDSALSLIGNTANFSISASVSAVPTQIKNLESPTLINTTSTTLINAGFWCLGSQAVYYQKAEPSTGTSDIIYDSEANTQISNFTNSGTLEAGKTLVGTLEYATVPSQITNAIAYEGNTNATFIWAPPSSDGGSPITSYTVQMATDAAFTSGVVTFTGITGTSTVVTGLTNGVDYYFRVAAVNAVAAAAGTTGEYSEVNSSTEARSKVLAPPGAPYNVIVYTGPEIVGSGGGDFRDELDIEWTAPPDNGATITSYIVTLIPEDGGTPVSIETGTSATSRTVTNLITNMTYGVTVVARNSRGLGPPSDAVFKKPIALGTAPKGVIKKYSTEFEAWVVLV